MTPSRWVANLKAAESYLGPDRAGSVMHALRSLRRATGRRAFKMAPNEDLFPRDEFAIQ
jgi:hypothetical protein